MWAAGVGADAKLAIGHIKGVRAGEIEGDENTHTGAEPCQPLHFLSETWLEGGWWLAGVYLRTPNSQPNSRKMAS